MKLIIILCFLLFSNIILSQKEKIVTEKDTLFFTENDYHKDLDAHNLNHSGKKTNCILCIQNDAAEFFKYSLMISEPSTVSSFSNWKIQYNGYQKKNYVVDWRTKTPYGFGKYFRIGKFFTHIHIEPSVNVRIFRNEVTTQFADSSLPVRTPSYVPGASMYFSHTKLWNKETNKNIWSFYGHFKAYHHSDGQDGAHFDSLGFVNRYNGDFGEQIVYQYGIGAINKKKSTFWFNLFSKKETKSVEKFNVINYYKLDIENSPIKLFGTIRNTSEAWLPYNLYGRTRLLFQFGHIFHPLYVRTISFKGKKYKIGDSYEKELFRIVGNIDYVLNTKYNIGSIYNLTKVPFMDIHRLNVDLSVHFRVFNSEALALFAQTAFVNNDRYNVYFQDRYLEFRIGLSYGWFNFGM